MKACSKDCDQCPFHDWTPALVVKAVFKKKLIEINSYKLSLYTIKLYVDAFSYLC